MPRPDAASSADRDRAVLTKAVLRAAERLGIAQKELAQILGLSAASLSRLWSGQRLLDPQTKEGELGLLFVRVFRSLDALLGGDEANCRAWLRTGNLYLGGAPLDLLKTVRGLVDVAGYLDAMRGQT